MSGPAPERERLSFLAKAFEPVLLILAIGLASALIAASLTPVAVGTAKGIDTAYNRFEALAGGFTHIPKFPVRSTIYADDGKTVLSNLYLDYNREIVQLHQVSPIAQKAVLAIEDHAFYQHGALNFSSMVRAMLANIRAGTIVQGGSTITQQLVKDTVIGNAADTFQRKLQEAAIALRVEQLYTKKQILQMYLNEVFLGNNVYGIGTAADFYFHRPASKLTLPQAALLAGMIQAPSSYDPIVHPKRAISRRNAVLDRLAELGWVSQQKVANTKKQPLGMAKSVGTTLNNVPPFFAKYIVDQILSDPNGEFNALGSTEAQRRHTLYQGGLKIYTTLDPSWQRAAQAVAQQPYAVTAANPGYAQEPDTAIVSVDVKSGAIRTMLSGRNYAKDQTALATARRQPGSSFKPFTLAAAFLQGVPPGETFSSKSPFHSPKWPSKCHCVFNSEGAGDLGYMDLWKATAESINVVFAQLVLQIGAESVVKAAQRMGITSPLIPVPSITLGTEDVSPLEMASAYQTLADQGMHCAPYAIVRIVEGTKTIYRHQAQCTRAIPADVANLVTALLRGVVRSGTGTAANLGSRPVAGKTGTNTDYSDAWFVGYTPQVSTAVWVGFPGLPASMANYFGTAVFGGTLAAPIWHDYMARVLSGTPVVQFASPPPQKKGTIPKVVGLMQAAAQKLLQKANFSVRVQSVKSIKPSGTVVAQSPKPGTKVPLGALVTISVSNGKTPTVVVPDVVGLTQALAEKQLQAAGLVVKVVTKKAPGHAGLVVAESPKAGTKVDAGSTVTITVGS
jgi:penicillin-binding protein 1A